MASKMSRGIQNFVSAVGEMQRAKKNIRRLKPLIAEKKRQVARKQFENGISQPKRWGGSTNMYR